MRLSKLLEITGYSTQDEMHDVDITEIVTDSGRATYNSMFICLSGNKSDGHRYITEALLKGAACVVIQRGIPNDLPESRKRAQVIVCDDTRSATARRWILTKPVH